MSSIPENERLAIADRYGKLPVWGVVSTYAAESFYDGLTLAKAEALVLEECAREPGRSACVVLVVRREEGKS